MAEAPLFLGIECGGTHTIAIAASQPDVAIARTQSGPCNLRLTTDSQLADHFRSLAHSLPPPAAIGVGMAGVRDNTDIRRVEQILKSVWPNTPLRVDHDLESALAAAEVNTGFSEMAPRQKKAIETSSDSANPKAISKARVIILSGTGSCCYGRNAHGKTSKVGGWGHHLGDRGSGYDISRTALRNAACHLDRHGDWNGFGREALRTLGCNEPNDLIAWMQSAGKSDIAALAPLVFQAAAQRDPAARDALRAAQEDLIADALHCAERLTSRSQFVEFFFAGSILLKQPVFARHVGMEIQRQRGNCQVAPLPRESVWGAVAMAHSAWTENNKSPSSDVRPSPISNPPQLKQNPTSIVPTSTATSPTELGNPKSTNLDRLPLSQAIDLMLDEDSLVPDAIREHNHELKRLIGMATRSLKAGGRLFYVGAGTSGRLGVLDASECPPTFRTAPEQIQGIIAGGFNALHSAVEGAEDDIDAGTRAIQHRAVDSKDTVVGIAASGRTPFVWGALYEARSRGAKTALISFNPHLKFARGTKPNVLLALSVGPEVLTGSTRLKAGTATKLILNILTTLTMVQLGKVMGNRMIDLNPSNVKLRDRACRIVCEVTNCTYEIAQATLEKSRWNVKNAIHKLSRN